MVVKVVTFVSLLPARNSFPRIVETGCLRQVNSEINIDREFIIPFPLHYLRRLHQPPKALYH
jgi:hypothetical protein